MGKDIICRPGFCIRSELQRFLLKLFYSKRDTVEASWRVSQDIFGHQQG